MKNGATTWIIREVIMFPDACETLQRATLFIFDFITEFGIVAQNIPHPGIE